MTAFEIRANELMHTREGCCPDARDSVEINWAINGW